LHQSVVPYKAAVSETIYLPYSRDLVSSDVSVLPKPKISFEVSHFESLEDISELCDHSTEKYIRRMICTDVSTLAVTLGYVRKQVI